MVRQRLAFLALILVVPGLASAQSNSGSSREKFGGGRAAKKADWSTVDSMANTAPKFAVKDVEALSSIQIVVDKKKDLKLTDDQHKLFKDLAKAEEEANKPHFDTLDSLRNALKVRPGVDPDQERARTSVARQEVVSVIRLIRASYDSSFKSALPKLDVNQQQAAQQLTEKEVNEAEQELQSKLGGRGGGSSRRRP
jgi:hypothetical protein